MTDLTDPRARRHVLVEDADPASARRLGRALRAAGYDVTLCGGPFRRGHAGCSLVARGRCALLDGVDVVLCRLWIENPRNRDVVAAIRRRRPALAVVVDAPPAVTAASAPLLESCRTVFTRTDADAVAAVDATLGNRRDHGP